jgi:protein-S-isoprenylcysteine O-methyltransferase Ste14
MDEASRHTLARRAFASVAKFLVALAAILFLTAWSLAWWQGWLFLVLFGAYLFLTTADLARHDPELLARRMSAGPRAEKDPAQKRIQTLMGVLFFLFILFPGLDHRFGWSSVPVPIVLAGELLVLLSMVIIFFVFRQNSFAASTVEIQREHHVISNGLYGLVRHPMYMGALVLVIGVPLALGSWWGLAFLPAIALLLARRLIEEERLLIRDLPGYASYRHKVRFRLVPHLW